MEKLFISLIITASVAGPAAAVNWNNSDPDLVATGYEFYGVPAVKVGDYVRFQDFALGGFIESRNEERFDQGPLPNHNWRGYGFFRYDGEVLERQGNIITLSAGLEHESAHPTGGFHENNDEAYEMIFDGLYRNINLNSLLLGFSQVLGSVYQLRYGAEYQFYFLSKNTPELHDTALTHSHGFSAGVEFFAALGPALDLFVSVFDRYIFRGGAEREDWIYHDSEAGVVQRYEAYPVINGMNTVVVKAGLLVNRRSEYRRVMVYGKMLYGNIFGFVDSREERLRFSAGVEMAQ